VQIKRRFKQAVGPILTLMLLLVFSRPGLGAHQQSNEAQPNPQSAAQSGTQSAHYLGSDACIACHEDVYKKSFEKTPHFKTTLKDGHGCESCHGPASEHVDGGGDIHKIISFKTLSRQEASTKCLSCHGTNLKQRHFTSSSHASNDVGCLDCHSPHHAKEPQHLLVQKEPMQCYSCHTTAKAEFARPYHHRRSWAQSHRKNGMELL
jgi:predicted CXXCH cytochrome family protein